jgi:branched-chain amino acid transport system ATP-binding protein
MSAAPLLAVSHLGVEIQAMPALRDLSVAVQAGEMVSLVGRNGAGKTTFMRTVMGHLAAGRRHAALRTQDLARTARHARAALGIGYMPEDRGLIPQLTVEETSRCRCGSAARCESTSASRSSIA